MYFVTELIHAMNMRHETCNISHYNELVHLYSSINLSILEQISVAHRGEVYFC